MKQHLNLKSSHMAAAFVPLEKLMCWKETRSKKEKRTEGKWGKLQGEKKSTNQALDTAKPRMY